MEQIRGNQEGRPHFSPNDFNFAFAVASYMQMRLKKILSDESLTGLRRERFIDDTVRHIESSLELDREHFDDNYWTLEKLTRVHHLIINHRYEQAFEYLMNGPVSVL